MIALAALALMSAAPAIVASEPGTRPAGIPTPPFPVSNPASWVTTEDYPPAALRAESQGIVDFRVEVGTTGEPTSCSVRAGSGDQTLDDTTCRLVMMRARFSPARDGQGKAVVGTYANKVRWIMPQDANPLEPGMLVRSYDILMDGSMANCRVDAVSGTMSAGFRVGAIPCMSGIHYERPLDSAGKPVIKHVSETMELRVAGDQTAK